MSAVPEGLRDLLERPLFAHVATVRPDGVPQSNPMWFGWDGEFVYLTHTKKRQKYRNVRHEPRVALSIVDPEVPYRYVEVRGVVERIDDDPNGSMYVRLAERYGNESPKVPADAPDRVVLVVRPTAFSTQA